MRSLSLVEQKGAVALDRPLEELGLRLQSSSYDM